MALYLLCQELHARGMSARVFDGTTSEAERRRIEAEVNSDDDHESTQFDKLIPASKTRILFGKWTPYHAALNWLTLIDYAVVASDL
jgi:hypothetical protein